MRIPARIPRRSAASPRASVSAAHENSSAKIVGVRRPLTTFSRAAIVSSSAALRVPSTLSGWPLTPSGTGKPSASRIVTGMSIAATTPCRRVVGEVSTPSPPCGSAAPPGKSCGTTARGGVCMTISTSSRRRSRSSLPRTASPFAAVGSPTTTKRWWIRSRCARSARSAAGPSDTAATFPSTSAAATASRLRRLRTPAYAPPPGTWLASRPGWISASAVFARLRTLLQPKMKPLPSPPTISSSGGGVRGS